jgi:hypothetical protein
MSCVRLALELPQYLQHASSVNSASGRLAIWPYSVERHWFARKKVKPPTCVSQPKPEVPVHTVDQLLVEIPWPVDPFPAGQGSMGQNKSVIDHVCENVS